MGNKATMTKMSDCRKALIGHVSARVYKDSTNAEIDAQIQRLLYERRPDWAWCRGLAFRYYVSNPVMQTTKLSEGQIKRLYKDIRERANDRSA